MHTITVKCPNCGDTDFGETSVAPVEVRIDTWELRGGLPHPDSYGDSSTFFEADELDEKPYRCTGCDSQFTADQLIVQKDD